MGYIKNPDSIGTVLLSTGSTSIVIDDNGNISGMVTIGGATSPAMGAGIQVAITNADTVND